MKKPTQTQQRLPLGEIIENRGTSNKARGKIAKVAVRHNLKSVCLFSSAGIGELGIESSGISIACANELVPYRVDLYRENFPNHEIIEGDIWNVGDEVVSKAKKATERKELFLLYATPPCQGMSTNGSGRLKWEIEQGNRAEEDPRNRLIIPTVDVIRRLRPRWVLLENVPGMQNTAIRTEQNQISNIIEFIASGIGSNYVGAAKVVACEDFGIPQKRRRLFTIFTRDPLGKKYFKENGGTFFPASMREPKRTLRDAIGHLPSLDSKSGKNERLDFHRYHYVNVLAENKYWWVENTPEGATALSNQCANKSCGYGRNRAHKDEKKNGKWVASKTTPIYCEKCRALLPRPTATEKDGTIRVMKGFHSAYRRMLYDEPARTLTQNFIYEASDNKIHPEQNRVLSVLEALIVQTIDRYNYSFDIRGKSIGTARIAEIIGESVPPYLIEKICSMMVRVSFPDEFQRAIRKRSSNLV